MKIYRITQEKPKHKNYLDVGHKPSRNRPVYIWIMFRDGSIEKTLINDIKKGHATDFSSQSLNSAICGGRYDITTKECSIYIAREARGLSLSITWVQSLLQKEFGQISRFHNYDTYHLSSKLETLYKKSEVDHQYRINIGGKYLFEYHCYEGHDSSDAQLWYHSHQPVIVLSMEEKGEGIDETERAYNGAPAVYKVKFEDDFVGVVLEDELVNSAKDFFRPDPPQTIKANDQFEISSIPSIPTLSEVVRILESHPLVGNIGKIKKGYLVGSFSKGTQNPQSDMDILLEIYPVKDIAAEEFAEKKRNIIRKYFLDNNIRGVNNSIHPQWNGRRLDIYFTYDASVETRPKIQLKP